MLTGFPRINGILVPQPQYEGEGDGRFTWEAEHVWQEKRRTKTLFEKKFVGTITFGWQNLKTPAFNKIVAALALETPVRFVPATRRAGDPLGAEENEYLCELTSPLPVYGAGDMATDVHSLSVSLKTTRTRESRDGISENALGYAFGFDADIDLSAGVKGVKGASGTTTYRTDLSGYEGQLLYATAQQAATYTVRLLGAEGAILQTLGPFAKGKGDSIYFEVADGTRNVEIETDANKRPSILRDEDGVAITYSDNGDGTATITGFGTAKVEPKQNVVTLLGGGYDGYTILPDAIAEQRIIKENGNTKFIYD